MHLDPQQSVDREVVLDGGIWAPGLSAVLRSRLSAGDAFIDIGAHKGYFSCLAAKLVGPSGLVVSIDPDPRAFEGLIRNVERNAYANVSAHQIALGAEEGTVAISLTATLGNTSSFPNRLAAPDVVQAISVPCTTLDRLLTITPLNGRRLPLIKIDAEGAEPLIWAGMQETLHQYRPVVAVEINYASLQAAGVPIRDFQAQMKASGYTRFFEYRVEHGRIALAPCDILIERDVLVDVLALTDEHTDNF